MARLPLMAYIFFASWTGVFALSPSLRLHYLIAAGAFAVAVVVIAIRGRFNVAAYTFDDVWVAVFLIIYIASGIVHPNDASISYVVLYLFVLIGLYFFMKGLLLDLTSRQIYIANLYGVSVVGIFLSVNFGTSILGLADLQGMMPRLRDTTASYAGMFVRGYAFSTEPGIVAYYLNTLGPLALWYLWSGVSVSRIVKTLLTALIVFGWIVTFSVGGLVALALALSIATILLCVRKAYGKFVLRYRKLLGVMVALLILVGGAFYAANSPVAGYMLRPIAMKLTFSQELNTATDRLSRYDAAYREIIQYPMLGRGPGYFSAVGEGSALNWYLMIAAEAGIPSLLCMLMFFLFVVKRILGFQHPSRFAVLVGFISACAHLMLMTTSGYLHPFIWLLTAIFYAQMARYTGMAPKTVTA